MSSVATSRLHGFTLIELMMTVLVGAVLLGIAVPAFRTFVQNTRLTSEANALVYSLALARDEAVKRDSAVEVCASANGTSCGGTWNLGWIVCTPSPGCATVIQVAPGLAGGNTVTEQLNGATDLTFSTNGQSQTGLAYQFVFCDNRGVTYGQDVELNLIGRAQAAQTAGQQVSGAPLGSC